MQAPGLKTPLLPQQQPLSGRLSLRVGRSSFTPTRWLVGCALGLAWVLYSWRNWHSVQSKSGRFYANITSPTGLCTSPQGPAVSHAGYIGLREDTEDAPKRSFFWFFEAEYDAKNAPIILTIGGGPGTSGMSNPMSAQGPCILSENGTVPNPNRWTEHFNLIALDHPIGVGFSNPFILSGGSYGGMYVPHLATVIHEQNTALAAGKGQAGAVHINLESMMVSNPISDATSHFSWLLQTRCYNADIYNASTCADMFKILPTCLDSIRFAQEAPEWSVKRRVAAQDICQPLEEGDTHGTVLVDIRKKCYSKDPMECLPPSTCDAE
ncbi:Alpha/Beta hydrolase protein [Mycena capillaripes]|nr:Alpha/Beta hydrolase protein [Mycena capillaripes]